jgi:hypothetical protein
MQKNFGKDTSKKDSRAKKSSKNIEAKTEDSKQKSYVKRAGFSATKGP